MTCSPAEKIEQIRRGAILQPYLCNKAGETASVTSNSIFSNGPIIQVQTFPPEQTLKSIKLPGVNNIIKEVRINRKFTKITFKGSIA